MQGTLEVAATGELLWLDHGFRMRAQAQRRLRPSAPHPHSAISEDEQGVVLPTAQVHHGSLTFQLHRRWRRIKFVLGLSS